MNKNFSDFQNYWKSLDMQQIQDDIINELNEYANKNNISDDDLHIWHMRSFNSKLSMKMLEEYHKWLND